MARNPSIVQCGVLGGVVDSREPPGALLYKVKGPRSALGDLKKIILRNDRLASRILVGQGNQTKDSSPCARHMRTDKLQRLSHTTLRP